MNAAVADCLIIGYEDLADTLKLPDPNDRHVLGAAIRAGAETIVTANLADFPAKHPDEFVVELINSAPAVVLGIIARQAADLRNPPRTVDEVLDMLQAVGLGRAVARVRELFGG
jgi:hypothetical protein